MLLHRRWLKIGVMAILLAWPSSALRSEIDLPSSSAQVATFPILLSLNQVGRTHEEQSEFNHLSAGTQLLPYDWVLALRKATSPSFLGPEQLALLHIVPDSLSHPHNPDELPVGFGETRYPKNDPMAQVRFMGITCAFCHTGQLNFTRLNGAGASQDYVM
jgi:hypothetical protein